MTTISVIQGDITQVKADAIITAVNSGGLWFGGIDSAIQRSAGSAFHRQLAQSGPLSDGDAFHFPATEPSQGAAFGGVIFVIDELERPVASVVRTGLELAVDNGLQSVSIPTIRTGVMAGARETREEALIGLAEAASQFADSSVLDAITIVVYNQPGDVQLLKQELSAKV